MANGTSIAPPPGSPLPDRLGHFAVPALHLCWRYFWRVLLLPIAVAFLISLGAFLFDSMSPHHRLVGFMSAAMGLGLLWFLLVPMSGLYGIWLMRRTVFQKPFLYRNLPHAFVVTYRHRPLSLPLPLENALAIWWGIAWRAWLGTAVAMMLLFFLGPLHLLLEMGIIYLAFLWFLADPYGHTRISIVPLGSH